MTPGDSDSYSDSESENPGELGWTEFDWEKYLRDQDDVIHRYLGFYEGLKGSKERIDDTAKAMGWDNDEESDDDEDSSPSAAADASDMEPYTLQKNPVFIATTAIYLSLKRSWERVAFDSRKVPQAIAVDFLSSLHRGELQALLAIQSLDLGDYTMAISLLKRAMRELNVSLSHLNAPVQNPSCGLLTFREEALPRLFDLREVWLRVIAECRDEVSRHGKSTTEDDGQL